MRMGHFLSQWGPEVVQLTDGMIKGKDGQTYRSRLIAKEPICGQSINETSEDIQALVSMITRSSKVIRMSDFVNQYAVPFSEMF